MRSCFLSEQGWKEKLGFSFLKEDKKGEEVPKEGTTGRKEIIVEQNNEIIVVYI